MSDPTEPSRAFLDANVLIAAAVGGKCAAIWELPRVSLVTSEYAVQEARWNLEKLREVVPDCFGNLERLLGGCEIVRVSEEAPLYADWALPDETDLPILQAAIQSGCAYLVTSDMACFGAFVGRRVQGLEVMKPGKFLARFGR